MKSTYQCAFCSHEMALTIDPTVGTDQEFIHHCARCNRDNLIHVKINDGGDLLMLVTPAPSELGQPVLIDVVQEASEESFPASDPPAY